MTNDSSVAFPVQDSQILPNQYNPDELLQIRTLLDAYLLANHTKTYAIREVVKYIPELWPLLWNNNLRRLLQEFDANAFLCKSLFFDKTPEANWYVGWHQDISIHVVKKITTKGFDGWTQKEDLIGVCAPAYILRQMLTVRIHLDDTTTDNGALYVIPDSNHGVLSSKEIEQTVAHTASVVCDVKAGGIHVMQPLLLHHSAKSVNNSPRRVIHLEFTSCELPNGLQWAERKPL